MGTVKKTQSANKNLFDAAGPCARYNIRRIRRVAVVEQRPARLLRGAVDLSARMPADVLSRRQLHPHALVADRCLRVPAEYAYVNQFPTK